MTVNFKDEKQPLRELQIDYSKKYTLDFILIQRIPTSDIL